MSTRAPSILAVAIGQIRYRLALAVISFGVFFGGLVACMIPLCVYASFFDAGGVLSETFRWALTGSVSLIAVGLTYHSRRWIIRKALEEASPQPVRICTGEDVVNAGLAVIHLGLVGLAGLVGLLVVAIVAVLLVYGGYLLLTMLSLPMAILIGAIIIALAILIAASA
jgi:hypothetical protein